MRIEVEGTGAALVKHDIISAEGLAVAETGLGLGVVTAVDEARSRGSRWVSTRWCSCMDIAGSSGSVLRCLS